MSSEELRQSFRQAFQNLQPQPLLTPEDQDKFLVPFAEDTLEKLEGLLELMPPDAPKSKIVLSGHTGCGKSTLLAELKRKIQQQYRVIFFSIADFVPPSDLTHIVLLFVMFLELLRNVRHDPNLELEAEFQEQVLPWLAQVSGLSLQDPIGFETQRREVEKETWFLDAIIDELGNSSFRESIEQRFETRVSDLIDRLNSLTAQVNQRLSQPQRLLFIIDDLDKLDLGVARKLFQENIKSFFQTQAPGIFTLPIAALSDMGTNSEIRSESYDLVSMPTIKLVDQAVKRNPDLSLRPEPKRQLEEILFKRVDRHLFDPEILDALILASGGLVRELIRLTSGCVFICSRILRRYEAEATVKVVIDAEVLREAKAEIWRSMALAVGKEARNLLEQVYKNFEPDSRTDETFLKLLRGVYIIEYANDNLWYDVHPIVAEKLFPQDV